MSADSGDFSLRSRRVVLPGRDEPVAATVVVRAGKIAAVELSTASGTDVTDVGNLLVSPGVVDTHVHVNEPGRTEWEGFTTATRAASLGGITTLIDMPLNSIPATTTLEALHVKAAAARGLCAIDYGFWGGVVPGNAGELEAMAKAGAKGFKAFLVESGVDEFKMVDERDLRAAMPILARARVPLLVHAELEGPVDGASGSPRAYSTYLASRPQRWEVDAVRLMIGLAAETGCRVHIVHLSAADALAALSEAKRRGVPISVETCPHYLTFSAEQIAAGETHYKCAPPIREESNRERLWQGLGDSTIDLIVSDHSPCTPALKKLEAGDFAAAWGGIAGLQFSLPAVWTEARARGIGPARVAHWMSAAPAKLAGLSGRKGAIAPGLDADLVVWDPDASYRVEPSMVRHRHALTPYAGRILYGKIEQTYVRGVRVTSDSVLGERL